MRIENKHKFKEFFDFVELPRKIDFLVLHHVEASSAEHAIEQFIRHKVSSHFLIDESGAIFNLVDENNIAYHAGTSFWKGCDSLNKNSIGIEFINLEPFYKKFETAQMHSGIELCKYLIAKYNIEATNIVGHSDIAYYSSLQVANQDDLIGNLNRKQDPSHLFDWKFLSENGVGIYPKISLTEADDKVLFELNNKDDKIISIKKNLAKFGYKISNFSNEFDGEMQALVMVFHRRFNQGKFDSDPNCWYVSSQMILDELTP